MFPVLSVGAALRGLMNGVLPVWITLAFAVGALGILMGMNGSINTDTGLMLFTLPGLAGFLLAATAVTYHGKPATVSPA